VAGAIRVVVSGAAGRMGEAVCEAVTAAGDLELAGRADPSLDQRLSDLLPDADVVVDFSTPEAALGNGLECVEAGVQVVIGTTGFDLDALRRAAEEARGAGGGANVFVAPNFAVGAVLMMRFAAEAGRVLPRSEIIELHNESKHDAPSGTAKATADLLVGDTPIHSVRLPGLVAHQEVLFGEPGALLTIRHDAYSREAYVPGVLLTLERLPSLPPGLTVGLESLL
jgi:4-hydroxy-tetrahydrodipicolinate reductase